MQLNVEQQKLIQNKNLGHSLLKGVAGSGKTTVAVCRIPFLLQNYCIEKDDHILMVTYNKSLTNYISYIYEMIQENRDRQIQLFDENADKEKLEITNIDKVTYFYFKKYIKLKNINISMADDKTSTEILQHCILSMKEKFPNVKLMEITYLPFLRKEITWIKACNYMNLSIYQQIDRVGRTSLNGGEGPQKLAKNSETRQAVFELMQLYNYRMNLNHICNFEDMVYFALKCAKEYGVKKYTHIIIDESQDLTKMQFDFIMQLYASNKNYSSLLFVADTAQSIYDTSWLIKGRSFTSIGLDMTGRSNALAKNYRTTTQIAEAAYSLIKNDDGIVSDNNYVKPSLIDRQGVYPVLKGFSTLKEEILYVKRMIIEKLSKTYKLQDIVVVARTKRLLTEVSNYFGDEVPSALYHSKDGLNFRNNDVKLLTMHSIKGLEFKVVILIGLNQRNLPSQVALREADDKEFIETMERKLLYVGMTRANERLYMSYHEKPSKFLNDIDGKFLKIQAGAVARSFYQIPVSDYMFMNQISDAYGKEESVRQWFLKELTESYQYPLKLIQIEYRVQIFSKPGYVDAVISIYKNNNLLPYILFEFKKEEEALDTAVDQLKSYMAVTKECCYGVVTNGNDFIVMNREYEIVEDIPMFDLSMLPSSTENFEYHDIVHHRVFTYSVDSDNELFVEYEGVQESFKEQKLVRLNVYSDIAAGEPILMTDELRDHKYLPFEWISSPSESFVLNVKGNSMKDANIIHGDQIVIKSQNTAQNGQIVAVELDGCTTLKRFHVMGNHIVLIAENQDYEPIMVSSDMVRVLGIAVGCIRKSGA